jgi:parallel beta-helix repeat protein
MRAVAFEFLPAIANGDGRTFHLADGYTVASNQTLTLYDADVLVGSATGGVEVYGTFNAEGTRFAAINPSAGWGGGIRYYAGSSGFINGATIEQVTGWGSHAIKIANASPYISGTTIRDAVTPSAVTGIYVYGPSANPTLSDNEIFGLTEDGIVVTSRAEARLIENTVRDVDDDGFVAGYQTRTFVQPPLGQQRGNEFDDNGGDGLYAASQAEIVMGFNYYPSGGYDPDGFNSTTGNAHRGIDATGSSSVSAGNSFVHQRNRIFGNAVEDARANGSGTSISAWCNWWDDTTPPFRISATNGGSIGALYFLTEDPYVNPNAPCVKETAAQKSSRGSAADASEEERFMEALALADQHPARGVAELTRIAESSSTHASAATAAVARVASRDDAPASARAFLEGRLARGDADARRGLLRVRHAKEEWEGALALAEALATSRDEDDRLLGYVARVHLYRESGRDAEAAVALAALEALAPGSEEAALAGAEVRSGETPRGAASREAVLALSAPPEAPALAPVRPNPTTGDAEVVLALGAASEVRVVVYDVLGREVARLADGRLGAGSHALSIHTEGWAPGLYLVSARVEADGGAVTAVSRFTLSER